MLKLAKFYTKIFFKSPIFLLSLIFNIFIFTVQIRSLEHSSILTYTSVICYAIISSNLFFLVSSSFIMSKKSEVMSFLEENKFNKFLVIILAGLITSIATSIIPIALILLLKNSNIQAFFVFKGILNLFIIWNLSNVISISIGAAMGAVLKKWVSIFLSLVVYSIFPINLFSPFFGFGVISRFLNIYGDSTTIPKNILSDDIINLLYICDKLFVVCLILLVVTMVKILLDKNKRVVSILAFCLVIVTTITIIYIGTNSVRYIDEYDVNQIDNVNYHIKTYQMDLDINNKLKNNVSIQLDIDNNIDSIVLLLDDSFKVNQINIDDKPAKYTHENDRIILDYKSDEQKSINVSISYEGYIYVQNDLGVDTFYSSRNVLNITDSLHWYPSLYDSSLVDYDINLNISSSNVYSNLNMVSQQNSFLSDKYILKGEASGVALFAGQYKKVIDNGIEYIIPSSYDSNKFIKSLEKRFSHYLEDKNSKLQKDELDILRDKKYKKVIVGMKVGVKNTIKISNDVLLVNL